MTQTKNHEQIKATIVCNDDCGKPVLYLSIHRADMEHFLLQKGKQSKDLITIVLRPYGVEY